MLKISLHKPARWLLFALTQLLSLSLHAQATEGYQWKNAPILGGGFVSGVVFSQTEKNLVYARTDVGGAYRWDASTASWIPLTDFLAASDENYSGILSIATDPSSPNRVYMATGLYTQSWAGKGAVFTSTNKGNNWTRVDLPIKLGGNEDGRSTGERLQVDPNLGSNLLLGSSTDGLWRSTDYGASWSQVSSFPVTSSPIGSGGISFVLFDKASGSAGSASKTIYVGVLQKTTTLYRSTDGGTSWSAVAGQPALMPHQAALSANGTLYLAYGNGPGPNGITTGAVWKYAPGTGQWTNISPPSGQGGYGGLSLDPQKPGTMLVSTIDRWFPKDEVFRTTDDGATWKPLLAGATFDHALAPYAATSTPHWIGDVDIDPFNSANAWFVTGYGVFNSDNLTVADAGTPVKWSFLDRGLEETVATGLISPPTGAPLISTLGDVDGFRHDNFDASPPAGRLSPRYGTTTDIDFAQALPNFMVRGHYNATAKYGAYSTDGGSNWIPFGSFPAGTTGGGTMAVSANGAAMVWAPRAGAISYSTDKGATWKPSAGSKAGVKPVSDRVNPLKFYSYDGLTGTVWVSNDGGATFMVGATGLPTVPDYLLYLTTLTASFGAEGDLWLTNPNGLYHSTNSGASFSKITSLNNAARVALGKAAPGKSSPAVYIVGTVNNQYGIFRSDDTGATWTRLNDNQHQFFGIRAFAADARTYGQVYLGTSGRGIIYGTTTVVPPAVVITSLEPIVTVQVSPNPSISQFRIQTNGPFTYVLYDMLGRPVETGSATGECLVGSQLRSGSYTVWIHPKLGQSSTIRLLKL